MPNVIPHSEMVRKAVDYIVLEIKRLNQNKNVEKLDSSVKYQLVEEACLKFDLSPMDALALHRLLEDELNDG